MDTTLRVNLRQYPVMKIYGVCGQARNCVMTNECDRTPVVESELPETTCGIDVRTLYAENVDANLVRMGNMMSNGGTATIRAKLGHLPLDKSLS